MGKKQHQKDKMYLTTTEWSTLYGGKKAASKAVADARAQFRRLPFYCCSLSLQPFDHPYCTEDGFIFDLLSILPYLKKYGHHPITGQPLELKQLTKLEFHKNAEGKFHCPVLFKVFNENSHIVAVRPTGNVFSFEAVDQLNLKAKNFKDLISDEPFSRGDIITLQDPTSLEKFDMSQFHHLQLNLKVDDEDEAAALKDPTNTIRTMNPEMRSALDALYKEYQEPAKRERSEERATARNAVREKGSHHSAQLQPQYPAHYSTGRVAQALTSTVAMPETVNAPAVVDRDILRYRAVKKKGYVRLCTNHGDLNVELHCDMVPKTCENFLILCKRGFYNGTVFHRSIRNFMIQGGDPTGTGKGGASAWGEPFKDEFKPNLTHQGRGILSMANSGPDTNKSQFFITFRSCRHLDNKHSVFGRVVGGVDVLSTMEKVETDSKDTPLEEIRIDKIVVFVDPFEEADEQLEEEERQEKEQSEASKPKGKAKAAAVKQSTEPTVFRAGIGKYLPKLAAQEGPSTSGSKRGGPSTDTLLPMNPPPKKPKRAKGGFGDFSSW